MAELTVEIDTRDLEKAIRYAPTALKYELADGMDRISKGFLKRFRAARLQGYPGVRGASGRGLYGTFKRASLVSPSIEGMGIEIFTDSKIASLHETGGIVEAKSGGWLAVPLSARKEMFNTQGKLRSTYKRPGKINNLRAVKLQSGRFLARVTKRTKKILPLFILKRRVKIEPRLGFYKMWDSLENYRIDILNQSIQKALAKI